MKKKLVSVILALTMCVSMMTGCKSKEAGTDSAKTNQESSTSKSETANQGNTSSESTNKETAGTETSSEAGTWEQTWPDGQLITWLIRDTGATENYSRYYDLKTIAYIEELFHVDIEFDVIGDNDQLTAKLTAGDLPDLMSWKWSEYYSEQGGIPGLFSDGICIDLSEMINTKMPNLKNIFNTYPNIRKDMMNNNGQYLFFQRINPLETREDSMALTSTGLVIRQDWLDNVGMSAPTNMSEWYDVLTAFKNMDPNGNGQKDEIPFDASAGGLMLFEAAYGMDGAAYLDADTGKVEYGARTQKYKAYLEEMAKWYSEGLIGNVFDEAGNYVKADAAGGSNETIVGDLAGSWKGLSNNNTKWTPTLIEKNPSAVLTACIWPATADGNIYSERTVSTIQPETILVTTDCKCPDAVAAVVDWMYSDEGSVMMTWGEKDVTYDVDANGNKFLTEEGNAQIELPDGSKPQAYKMYGNVSGYMPSFGNFDCNLATRDPWYIDSSRIWAEASFDIRYPGAINLTSEQAEKVSVVNNTELFNYIAEMKWKFITGQEPLSNFDTYLANLDRMGIANIVAVYQEAYDSYMAR